MLTVFGLASAASERSSSSERTFGSVRIAQKDQKSIRINPTLKASLAQDPRGPPHPTAIHGRRSWDVPASTPALRDIPSLRCQVCQHALARSCRRRLPGTELLLSRMDVWWSQSGSNRRPQACKASALPTELWPRSERARTATEILKSFWPITRMWWAWEDLNFRPHAYQARALTN